MAIALYESIHAAISDYIDRHGEKPSKIIMSDEAFKLGIKGVNFSQNPKTYCGIPLHVTFESGLHVQLCEPEITLFEAKNPYTIEIPTKEKLT